MPGGLAVGAPFRSGPGEQRGYSSGSGQSPRLHLHVFWVVLVGVLRSEPGPLCSDSVAAAGLRGF